MEQLLRQIRVLFPQYKLRIVPCFRDLGPKLIGVQAVHQCYGFLQTGLAAGGQQRLIFDDVPGSPCTLLLS